MARLTLHAHTMDQSLRIVFDCGLTRSASYMSLLVAPHSLSRSHPRVNTRMLTTIAIVTIGSIQCETKPRQAKTKQRGLMFCALVCLSVCVSGETQRWWRRPCCNFAVKTLTCCLSHGEVGHVYHLLSETSNNTHGFFDRISPYHTVL